MTDDSQVPESYLDAMTQQYVGTALWSSLDDNDEPLDSNYGPEDLAPDTLTQMREDCADFAQANWADLYDMDPGQAGHDFWLTRNRHGAGFWDRGLGAKGERLTEMSKPYGEVYLLICDDGTIC